MSIRHYQTSVFYQGTPLPGVTVTVLQAGTSILATLFDDINGTIPKVNPFTNDATFGTVSFYTEEGTYDIDLAKTGYVFPPLDNILVGAPAYLTNIVDVPTINGASQLVATNAFPVGASDVKVYKENVTGFGVTGGLTGIDVGDSVVQDRWGHGTPLTQGDITTQDDFQNYDPSVVYVSGGSVLLTAAGGVFDATGSARVTVKYRLDTAS